MTTSQAPTLPASLQTLRSAFTAPFRALRTTWRLTQVVILVLGGLLIVRFFFPFWSASHQRRVKQLWAAFLVDSLGVTLEAPMEEIPPQSLVVCNHISWLDVFVINAVAPTTFVCKDDVRAWPALGWLVAHTGTLFIERGNRAAAARSAAAMAQRLREGERIAVFPEGTTTQGHAMLPFRPALFEAAVEAASGVQPLGLRYLGRHDELSLAPAYDGDISFGASMLAIASASGLRARLQVLSPLEPSKSRRELASQSEQIIACALGFTPQAQLAPTEPTDPLSEALPAVAG
ncbi:lysophospholipid acyltransferase family protein [Uliginosibacterium aquaticum]|uniref:1-acyl-sn-glycerol-3-phosphate acyltransferase n=1 Tax=Uliginosibacterium aquaticum TaxID=2731212 RepID=A0ABX2IFL7_9RHOO|nr:lysophospholipid acyltransferase family protein [Uliginosibacterium aquaticum]NSL53772.1 1-acyl-sn-glycerol-3-phosphate acyltransferase [Uliginosibacterium aquaticum]